MLRVLHVVPSINLKQGGPSRSVLALVDTLRNVPGLQISLATANATKPVEHPLEITTRWSLLTNASKRLLKDAIQQADIIELHSIWNGVISFAAKTARRCNKPYIITPRGMLDPYCLRTRGWLKQIAAALGEEKNIGGACGFHLLSEEEKQGLLEVRPYLKDRELIVCPNGVDPLTDEVPSGVLYARYPETKNRKVVLFLGRLDEIKGLELPLEALSLMQPAERPMVLMVGPDWGMEARLRAVASQLGVAPWVIFGGAVYSNERFGLLREADVVASTSFYECNSVSATEAFMVGGVVLATEGTGLRAASQAGAAVVVPRTASDFADALRNLLADDARQAMLRKSGMLYAQRQLAWNRLVTPLVEMYHRLAKRTSGETPCPK